MPAHTATIDQAYKRYDILSKLIALEQKRAQDNPQHQRYLDLGITTIGDTKLEATQKITEIFDELAALIAHVAILDLAASFELSLRLTIATAAIDVKKLVKNNLKDRKSKEVALRLVKDEGDFQGLQSLTSLIDGAISKEVAASMKAIRTARNSFAHGTNIKIPPLVEPEQARDILQEIASRL